MEIIHMYVQYHQGDLPTIQISAKFIEILTNMPPLLVWFWSPKNQTLQGAIISGNIYAMNNQIINKNTNGKNVWIDKNVIIGTKLWGVTKLRQCFKPDISLLKSKQFLPLPTKNDCGIN